MPNNKGIVFAAKSAPIERIFLEIEKAGLKAVEVYLSEEILNSLQKAIKICRKFPFRYALHVPVTGFGSVKLVAELAGKISAEIIVFHNVYWEDEWGAIFKAFKGIKANLCVENTYSVHEPLKFMRRYGMRRCLDLEHMQMECCGFYEEEFIKVIRQASHIHLTGYTYGSQLWHTHIHSSIRHNLYLLNLLKKAGYSGLVVSEARQSLQTYREFKKLNEFYKRWSA